MSLYKYLLLFSFFFICCEKNSDIQYLGKLNLQLCNNEFIEGEELSVLSFNRWDKTSFYSAVDVINAVNPDIVALQESFDIGIQLADYFNFCFIGNNDESISVLSKFPIEIIRDNQYKIILNDMDYVNFFNVHLPAHPYQPYDIRDTLITTPAQAIHQAEQTRGIDVDNLVEMISGLDDMMPIIVAGDFNEPSHLDWINHAANPTQFQFNNSGEPFVVNWPASNKMQNLELIDSYRQINPNPIESPGYTWTPFYNVDEVHDRIDYIYYKNQIELDSIFLVGSDIISDIIIENYESDHRSVFAKFKLNILERPTCEFCDNSQ